MPILRSQHQAELLTLLLLHPGTEYSITELSEKLGVPLTTVQREVNRFLAVGLITEQRQAGPGRSLPTRRAGTPGPSPTC